MTHIGRRSPAAGLLAATALAVTGCCGSGLAPCDPDCARDALHAALAAWARGETPESLAHLKPCIHVGDSEWAGGRVKLVRYEVTAPPAVVGAGLRFQATLTTRDDRGRSRRQAVCYRVYTAPHVSVVREVD
ncbi:MAG TPA: hypothetical protein VGF55_32455 [Gemmataceae bacterium]|jgi:hypothetical protein